MKQPRFAVFCHATDALPNPQGLAASRRRKNRFRSAGITFLHPNTETSFRLLPSATFFWVSPRLFRMTFCNFAVTFFILNRINK